MKSIDQSHKHLPLLFVMLSPGRNGSFKATRSARGRSGEYPGFLNAVIAGQRNWKQQRAFASASHGAESTNLGGLLTPHQSLHQTKPKIKRERPLSLVSWGPCGDIILRHCLIGRLSIRARVSSWKAITAPVTVDIFWLCGGGHVFESRFYIFFPCKISFRRSGASAIFTVVSFLQTAQAVILMPLADVTIH